jgi:hypothetical protein
MRQPLFSYKIYLLKSYLPLIPIEYNKKKTFKLILKHKMKQKKIISQHRYVFSGDIKAQNTLMILI